MNAAAQARFELHFQHLHQAGRVFAVPCDEAGRVDLDTLSERAKLDYYYARTVIGREFARPAVRCTLH